MQLLLALECIWHVDLQIRPKMAKIHKGHFAGNDAFMPAEPKSPDPAPNSNPGDTNKPNRSRRFKVKTAIIAAGVTAIGAIVVALINGVFGLFANSPAPPPSSAPSDSTTSSAQACSGFRADATIPPQVGPYAVLTIDFICAPAAGQQYLWVVEAQDIGTDDHSEFYPKPFTSGVHVGIPFTHTIDFHDDKIGQRNCFYVISVTSGEYQNIESNLNQNNFTLHLPDGADRVSAPACETRVRQAG